MNIAQPEPLPSRFWIAVRLASLLLTAWMAIGYFVTQHGLDQAQKLAAGRAVQAAQIAGVPLSKEEETAFGTNARRFLVASDDGNGARLMAISALTSYESDRASDFLTGMIATVTAGVGSLVVFAAGLRDFMRRRSMVSETRLSDRGR